MADQQPQFLKEWSRTYTPGEWIFCEGDMGGEMYLIESGEIVITKRIDNLEKPITTFKSGDFFGEMAVLNRQPRSAGARATTPCACWVINADRLETLLKNHPAIGLRMMRKLSERIRQTDHLIENLLLTDEWLKLTNALLYFMSQKGPELNEHPISLQRQSLAIQADVQKDQVDEFLQRLEIMELAKLGDHGEVTLTTTFRRLAQFKEFLQMKKEFEDPGHEAVLRKHPSRIAFF